MNASLQLFYVPENKRDKYALSLWLDSRPLAVTYSYGSVTMQNNMLDT